jgi:cytidine deaminase
MDTTDADLIEMAASALNRQRLGDGSWAADVGAAVEADDGTVFTGASIGGYLSLCAEQSALAQMLSSTGPVVRRVVAVWRDPDSGGLHVLPPCGRCRELLRVVSQDNLDAFVILGTDHRRTLRELLPFHGWHAELVVGNQN